MDIQRRDAKRREYNKKTYVTHLLRVRADSELVKKLEEYKDGGGSVNWLLNELLCKHFDVPMPHRYRFEKKILETYDVQKN